MSRLCTQAITAGVGSKCDRRCKLLVSMKAVSGRRPMPPPPADWSGKNQVRHAGSSLFHCQPTSYSLRKKPTAEPQPTQVEAQLPGADMTDRRTIKTMCPMNCHPTLCGMTVSLAETAQVSISGDDSNPDSRGFLCMRGNAAQEIVGNDQRLLTPLIRNNPKSDHWQEASWAEAMDLIAARMAAVGREAVGLWQGHGNAVNDYGFGLKRSQMERFASLYGCQHWNPAMICWGLGGFGLGITGALETSTKEDMGSHSEMILLWGANTVSQAHTIRHVEMAKRRGAKIVVIDVRRTEASALADEVLLVRPGSDAALALAMLHVIAADQTWDRKFVTEHTVGFDALVAHLEPMTPDWAQSRTGAFLLSGSPRWRAPMQQPDRQ